MKGIAKDVHASDGAHDRLTRIAAAMTRAAEQHPEFRHGDRIIAMIHDDHRAGLGASGYEDMAEVMVDLLGHLEATFKAAGKRLEIIGIPESPEGIEEL